MIQLKLLILCLLVSFKGLSQIDTVKKIVLTDNVARQVIKDIVKGDNCKNTLALKDQEINNFKDIIKAKDNIISKQESLLNIKPKIHVNMYSGFIVDKVNLYNPSLFSNLNFSYLKYNISIWGKISPEINFNYGLSASYKIF